MPDLWNYSLSILIALFVLGCSTESPNEASKRSDTASEDSASAPTTDTLVSSEPILCSEEASLEIYERRIAPLVSGEVPSSCNQCHLSGVELSLFVQATPCDTISCMASLDLVNLENAEESRILEQILMAEPDSKLITEDVLKQEYEGFLEWIRYQEECFEEVCGPLEKGCNAPVEGVAIPEGVLNPLGECSEPSLVSSFEEKVFSQRKRCMGCHGMVSDHADDPPFWMNSDFDESDPASMSESALKTMYNLVGLGAINAEDPEKSMMLCRHLALSAGGCGPGNHIKFQNKADPAYKSILEWIEVYADCF